MDSCEPSCHTKPQKTYGSSSPVWSITVRKNPVSGGAGGIRTLDTGLPYTHFPGVRLRPLGHCSAFPGRRVNMRRDREGGALAVVCLVCKRGMIGPGHETKIRGHRPMALRTRSSRPGACRDAIAASSDQTMGFRSLASTPTGSPASITGTPAS